MRIAKEQVDVQLAIPGATLRQHKGFGDVRGYDTISCEYFSLAAGVDTTPLFIGLEGDMPADIAAMTGALHSLLDMRRRSGMRTIAIANFPRSTFEARYSDSRLISRLAQTSVVRWYVDVGADMRRGQP